MTFRNVIFCDEQFRVYSPPEKDWPLYTKEPRPSEKYILAQLADDAEYRWLLLGKEWTEKNVKEELPDVPIEISGKIFMGKVTGRKMPFAVVSTDDYRYDFAWSTVANALNENRPLRP